MAEHGSVAAGKYGGMTPPVIGESGVANRIDASVEAAQSACLEGA